MLSNQRHLAIKRANMHELFFDLIFVYAMQKIAHVLLHTHHGTISGDLFFKYVVMSLILWIIWSHQTFFTNRFGELIPKDVGFMLFNMFILVFLSNSLYPNFEKTFAPFFFCVGLMYLSIALQYLLHLKSTVDTTDKKTCQAFASVAFTVALLSFVSLVLPKEVHYIPAFLGVFIAGTGLIPFRKYLNLSPVNMMHLVERFSLLTIIIFGEVLVGLTTLFDIKHFSYINIFQFILLISLFGFYWLMTERFINHKQKSIGFRLVYTHLLINIALGMLNAALVFIDGNELSAIFEVNLMFVSVLLFYIGLWANMPYFHAHLKHIKPLLYSIGLIVFAYIISLCFAENSHVMIISIAITNSIIVWLYYKYAGTSTLND